VTTGDPQDLTIPLTDWATRVMLRVGDKDADPEELAELTSRLGRELLDLDVEAVELERAGKPRQGSEHQLIWWRLEAGRDRRQVGTGYGDRGDGSVLACRSAATRRQARSQCPRRSVLNRNIITSDDARGLARKQLAERDKVLIHEGARLGAADTGAPQKEAPKPANHFDRLLTDLRGTG